MPGFLVAPLALNRLSIPAGESQASPTAPLAAGLKLTDATFSAQFADLTSQPNLPSGNQSDLEALGAAESQAGAVKELQQNEGNENSPPLAASLPVPAVMATYFGPFPALVEAAEGNAGGENLPEIELPKLAPEGVGKNAALMAKEKQELSGIFPSPGQPPGLPIPPQGNSLIPQSNGVLKPSPAAAGEAEALGLPSPGGRDAAPLLTLAPGSASGAVPSGPGQENSSPALSLKAPLERGEGSMSSGQPGAAASGEIELSVPLSSGGGAEMALDPGLEMPAEKIKLQASPGQPGGVVNKDLGALPAGEKADVESPIAMAKEADLNLAAGASPEEMEMLLPLRQRNLNIGLSGGLSAAMAPENPAALQESFQTPVGSPVPLRESHPPLGPQSLLGPSFIEAAVSSSSPEGNHNQMNLALEAALQQPEWGEELSERVTWLVKDKIQIAELRLNPAQLGPLEARINVHNDEASIAFHAPQAAVREALEAALPRLREALAEQGLTLVNVDVSQHGFSEQQRPPAQPGSLRTASGEATATANQEVVEEESRSSVPEGRVDYYA